MNGRTFVLLCLLGTPSVALAQPEPLWRRGHKDELPRGAIARIGGSPFILGQLSYNALVLSPDGKRIAAGMFDVVIHDADTGAVLRELLPGGGNTVHHVQWSQDGRFLFVNKWDYGVQIFDTTNGKAQWVKPLSKGLSALRSVRFCANNSLLASVHIGPKVNILDIASGTLKASWTQKELQKNFAELGDGFEAWQVAFSRSGDQMAWLAISPREEAGSAVLFFETASGKLLHTLKRLPYTTAIDLLDDGKTLVLHPTLPKPNAKEPPHFIVVNVADGRTRFPCAYRGVPPDYDRKVVVVEDGFELKKPIYNPGDAVAVHRNVLYTRDREGLVRWNLATGNWLDSWDQPFGAISVSADGMRMLIRGTRSARVIDAVTDTTWTDTFFWGFGSIRYLPDGKLEGVAGARVHVWDPKTKAVAFSRGRMPRSHREDFAHLEGTTNAHFPIALRSADGKRTAYGIKEEHSKALLVRWFDDATGKELGRHRVPEKDWFRDSWLASARWFDDDGKVFGYITPDSRLVRVECGTGKVYPPIGVPNSNELVIERGYPAWQYWPAGPKFILAMDRISAVLNPPNEQEYRIFDHDGKLVRQFAFFIYAQQYNLGGVVSPDARVMAVSSTNFRLYETLTGGRLWPYDMNGGPVAISPDSKFLAKVDTEDLSVLVFDLDQLIAGHNPPAAPKTAKEAQKLWEALNDEMPKIAIPAGMALAKTPELALPLIKDSLRGPDPKQLTRWIAQLESANFGERLTAEKELNRSGEWATGALQAALKKPLSVEQRRRIEKVLADLAPKPVTPDTSGEIPPNRSGTIPPYLREVRALAVLERIGTPDARKVLEQVAAGDDNLIAREARLILAHWR